MWDSEKRAYAEMSTASVQQVAVVSVLSARHRCLRATFERCALFILLQMMGRAGRPGFDTSGTAVIMTSNEKAPQWRQISAGAEPIESQLLPNVAEVLVSEAAQHVIRNIADAIEFLKSTFLFTRLKRNPGRYGLPSNSSGAALDTFLNESVLKSLNLLSSAKILGLDEDGFGITIHDAAPIMSKVSKFEACTPEAHHTSDRCCCAPQYVDTRDLFCTPKHLGGLHISSPFVSGDLPQQHFRLDECGRSGHGSSFSTRYHDVGGF